MSNDTQKPRIVVFEGTDGTGKDYHLIQTVGKYTDYFIDMRFPSDMLRGILKNLMVSMNHQNIDHIKAYNNMFLGDFIAAQKYIRSVLENAKDRTLLINRYFFSSLAYARLDISKYYNGGQATDRDFEQWNNYVEDHYYPLLDTLIQPDICIYLSGRFAKKTDDFRYKPDELLIIQQLYEKEMDHYNDHRMSMGKQPIHLSFVESHMKDNKTFDFIEGILAHYGVIPPLEPEMSKNETK